MKITVRVQSNYGIQTVYPLCETSKILARIANTKTLTAHALRDIQLLGYEIEVKQDLPKVLRALAAI